MQLTVKITGWESGKRKSFTKTIDTPDFIDKQVGFKPEQLTENTKSLLGRTWEYTALQQQIDWLDDNYESIVVPLAEERFYYPIEGFKVVTKKEKRPKIEDIIDRVSPYMQGRDEDFKAIFMATLYQMWPSLKSKSVDYILKTVFQSMEVTNIIATSLLKDISAIFRKDDQNTMSKDKLLGKGQ